MRRVPVHCDDNAAFKAHVRVVTSRSFSVAPQENKEVYEGEVTELTPEETESMVHHKFNCSLRTLP